MNGLTNGFAYLGFLHPPRGRRGAECFWRARWKGTMERFLMGASTLQEDVREAHFFKGPITDFVSCEFSTLQVDGGAARALGGSGGWTLWSVFNVSPRYSKRRPGGSFLGGADR